MVADNLMTDHLPSSLGEVLSAYCPGSNCKINQLGSGNINDTYVVDAIKRKFVLQRINAKVFPHPKNIITNFAQLTDHIRTKSDTSTQHFLCPQLLRTIGGEDGFQDSRGDWWRAQSYIPHLHPQAVRLTSETAVEIGRVLATFHLLTLDLPARSLNLPLPDFHSTPKYLADFDSAFTLGGQSKSRQLQRCYRAVEKYRESAALFTEGIDSGILRLRVMHGDPKLDNIIFNDQGMAMGLFDLDTVGPGLILYDLGDCLRSCCNSSLTESGEYAGVKFDMTICKSILVGYLEVAEPLLSDLERAYIYQAVLLITFELGLRFLTDHLKGDIYFKVEARGENLQRALVQFALADSIAAHEMEIRNLTR